MAEIITRGEQNLYLLQSLIPGDERFYLWCYGSDGSLLGSSCRGEIRETLHHAFCALGGYDKMLGYVADPESREPLILGSSVGMYWAVTLETERKRSMVLLYHEAITWNKIAGIVICLIGLVLINYR